MSEASADIMAADSPNRPDTDLTSCLDSHAWSVNAPCSYETLCWSRRSVQLSGPGSVRLRGETPPSVRPDRQLRPGEFRIPGIRGALRPMLLALPPRLPRPRTQRGADPTGRSPVSLPGNQGGGPERGGGRPHVLRRRKPLLDEPAGIFKGREQLRHFLFGLKITFLTQSCVPD